MQTAAYNVSLYHTRENDVFCLKKEKSMEIVHKTMLKPLSGSHTGISTVRRKRSMSLLLPSHMLYSEPAPSSAEVSNSSAQDRSDSFFVGLTHSPTPAM